MDSWEAGRIAVEASLLEVSGTPKPGNVHRLAGLPDLSYEDFLKGAPCLFEPSARAYAEASKGRARVGYLIKLGVSLMLKATGGKNTHLGTLILAVPTSAAAALGVELGEALMEVLSACTSEDSAMLAEAIRASGSSVVGELRDSKLDVWSMTQPPPLLELLEEASSWDMLCRELVKGLPASRSALKVYASLASVDLNAACVHTYLTILASQPDTHVARKAGMRLGYRDPRDAVEAGMPVARWVSEYARRVLDAGGLLAPAGRALAWRMDRELRSRGLSPGASADLTALSIMLYTLSKRGLPVLG
ncbi:MAG: hypothetical protein DRN99_02395 [Thermoproteota archaeon]|nr:MAG: hypothetical protein DRN99_02395 [Candidatus Korarchaeota archaeon]